MSKASDRSRTWARSGIAPTLALLLSALFSSCRDDVGEDLASSAPPADPPAVHAPFRDHNVVIVLVDTLRADALGLYGYSRPTSPHLEKRAAQWQMFERCSAAASWTLPSVSAMMTSQHAFDHGALDIGDTVQRKFPVLAEVLSDAGYRTAAFATNPFIGSLSGLDRGFESLSGKSGNAHSIDLDEVRPFLTADDRRPFFLYLHSTEPHRPYQAPGRFVRRFGTVDSREVKEVHRLLRQYRTAAQRFDESGKPVPEEVRAKELRAATASLRRVLPALRDLYDGGVAWADANFAKLLTLLEERELLENTIVLFLSDHGEELAEHGTWLHAQSLYEELLHVPMLWRLPGTAGQRIPEPVSTLDVVPTLVELLGIETEDHGWVGHSLAARMMGERDALVRGRRSLVGRNRVSTRVTTIRRWACSAVPSTSPFERVPPRGIWSVDSDRFELYDLARDAGESSHLEGDLRVREFRQAFQGWLEEREPALLERAQGGGDRELTPEERARLEHLGYLDPLSSEGSADEGVSSPAGDEGDGAGEPSRRDQEER